MNKNRISVLLNAASIASAHDLAQKAQELYKDCSGPYGDNSIAKHFIGKLGETAVSCLFQKASLKVKEEFAKIDRQSRSDVTVKIRRRWVSLEVKTFSESRWPEYGRVVSEVQVNNISENSDFIFWCCASPADVTGQTALVEIMGYSPVSDLLDQSLHCQAYKPETIQLLESSLRHPRRFCQDLESLFEARRMTLLAERKARMAERCQNYRNATYGGRYFKLLRQAQHARYCVSGCIEAGF